jgi:glucose-1-phosphate cytidylyltransferase
MKQDKGVLDIEGGAVKSFREKNLSDGGLINAGYIVF